MYFINIKKSQLFGSFFIMDTLTKIREKKKMKNKIVGILLMYKVCLLVKPIQSIASTGIVLCFVYSISKIFGL